MFWQRPSSHVAEGGRFSIYDTHNFWEYSAWRVKHGEEEESDVFVMMDVLLSEQIQRKLIKSAVSV